MNRKSVSVWGGAMSLLLLATSAWTQDYRGRVEGLISDPTQAIIAGANVTLLNVNTGTRAVRQTSPTGLYLFDLLDPGTYSLTVETAGFGKYVQQNIIVQTRGDVTVNVTLNPGAVQESITVNESPVDVQFNSSTKDLTIDSKMPSQIPACNRYSLNLQRQHLFGGTLGNPIKKNKLFNFASVEYWKGGYPNSYVRTVPTAAEQAGDFSQTRNVDGSLRTIYDPFSTKFDPATGAVTRTPFPGNKIPADRFDPLASSLMKQFWAPNNAGDNITGVNNFKKGFIENYDYYNFSDPVRYNITDNYKVFGPLARYNTTDLAGNPTPNNSQLYVPTGTSRGSTNIGGDAIWSLNARTVVEFHGDWHKLIDAYVSPDPGANGWASIWPNNPWYVPYQTASVGVPVYFPDLNIGGQGFGGGGFYWNQKPQGEAASAKIAQQRGSHYLKAGFEQRKSYGLTY